MNKSRDSNHQQDYTALLESEKILRHILFKLSRLSTVRDQPFENRLEAMRTSIKDGLPTSQLIPLFEEIDRYLERMGPQTAESGTDGEGIQLASELLLSMLDAINSPSALVDRIEPVKALLHTDVDKKANNYFVIAMQSFFDELNQFHQEMHDENKLLQTFLLEMSGELREIKKLVQPAGDDQQAKTAEKQLDQAIEQLATELEVEADVSGLTKGIRKCLKSIRHQVAEFKRSESERHRLSSSLIDSLKQKIGRLEQEAIQLKARLVEKDRQYLTDSLTVIPNRVAYEERLKQECDRFKRDKTDLCLLVCDVDNFKVINDTYGHAAGDQVLKQLAEAMRQNIRSVDFVARYGGEEFVIIIHGAKLDNGIGVAEKLRKKIEMTHFMVKNIRIPVTFSAGLAELREDDSPASLFERADNALYIAKECGKNRVESE